MRADALLSRFGYCTRREAAQWLRAGRVVQEGRVVRSASEAVKPENTLVDGLAVPFPHGLCVALHKPVGYTCSHSETEGGRPVYELLPEQWLRRSPEVQTVGRLDKETSGLLLLTDDGALLHALTSPRRHVPKVYEVVTEAPIPAEAVEIFAGGELMLRGEKTPCLPAQLEPAGECRARITLHEGRYHQVRRMFAAVGAPVQTLCRVQVGPLALDRLGLSAGEWVEVDPAIFSL